MPTVIFAQGWRLFFYSNEGNEPMHIHAEKSDAECKFWIDEQEVEITVSYAYNCNAKELRGVKKLIFQHFDEIVEKWHLFFKK